MLKNFDKQIWGKQKDKATPQKRLWSKKEE
jgi:hypothetical protein